MSEATLHRDVVVYAIAAAKATGRGVSLSGRCLAGVDLRGLDLQESDLSGADLSRADLSGADLRKADLSGANLYNAKLTGANLHKAKLDGADLHGANLNGADLSYALLKSVTGAYCSMRGASLRQAMLLNCELRNADLSGAILSGASTAGSNMVGVDLRGADLSDAVLSPANISKARLGGASGNRYTDLPGDAPSTFIVPPEGPVVGWKKCAGGVLAKLLVPRGARCSNAFGRKCRAERAFVLEVVGADVGRSMHDPNTVYRKGETVRCHLWERDRRVECAGGIHFFITREEAEEYVYI